MPLDFQWPSERATVSITSLPMTWFEELFGFPESVRAVKANFTVTETENSAILTSKVNNRSFNAGRFSIRNIASFSHVLSKPSTTPGTLNVIQGNGANGSNSDICSVLETQSLPEINGATFQAASNFNCLEFCGPGESAAMGVTRYVYDCTQGPYCALATGAATVYRNYFAPHSDGARGQLEKDVQLLEKTPIGRFVQDGYPVLGLAQLKQVEKADWDDLDQFYVGLHENCEVTTMARRGSGPITSGVPEGQIVHHVYAAAFNFAGTVARNETSLRIARQMLSAEYQATVLAGWEMSQKYPGYAGSGKLFLTAIGGGVFANPLEIIVGAVASAKDLIQKSGLQVYFVCFDRRTFDGMMSAGLKQLIEELSGKIVTKKEEL
jgi:hypothetical protein